MYQITLLHPHTPNQWLVEVQRTPQYKRSCNLRISAEGLSRMLNCHMMTEHFESGQEERLPILPLLKLKLLKPVLYAYTVMFGAPMPH